VDIGCKAVLIPHIRIGDGSVIGANAMVTRDAPTRSLAVGVPARVLRRVTAADGGGQLTGD